VIDNVIAAIAEAGTEVEVIPEVATEIIADPVIEHVIESLIQPEADIEVVASLNEGVKSGVVARFETMLDSVARERVIRKVFNRDVDAFQSVVDDVLRRQQWKEAAGVLDRYFAREGVAPDSAAAMEFAQALHRSFV